MMPFCFQKGDLVWYTALFRLRRWYLTIPPSYQWIAMVDIDNHRKPLLPTAFTVFFAFRLRKPRSHIHSVIWWLTLAVPSVCKAGNSNFLLPLPNLAKSIFHDFFWISLLSFFVNCHCHGTVIMIKWLGSCPWSCDHLEWQIWVNWKMKQALDQRAPVSW